MPQISPLDKQRIWLASGLVLAFCACLLILLFKAFPQENKDIIIYMIGQLSGMSTMSLGFYFTNKAGADEADAKKTENTGKMAEAITATAKIAAPASVAASEAARATAEAATERAEDFAPTDPLKFEAPEEVKREHDI